MELHKIIGQLGEVAEELDTMDEKELHTQIVQAETAMKTVKEELEANTAYQKAKDDVKSLSAGKRDLDKYQKAKVQYSLHRLEELGKMDLPDRLAWDRESAKKKLEARAAAEKKAKAAAEEKLVNDTKEGR